MPKSRPPPVRTGAGSAGLPALDGRMGSHRTDSGRAGALAGNDRRTRAPARTAAGAGKGRAPPSEQEVRRAQIVDLDSLEDDPASAIAREVDGDAIVGVAHDRG